MESSKKSDSIKPAKKDLKLKESVAGENLNLNNDDVHTF